ncbi:MAG: hypothetical protein ACI89J_000223 [Hyphomicrobiaceae bacterium]|jgi:hypothetical protein
MSRIGIAAIADLVTTARYFERAVAAAGHDVVVLEDFDNSAVLGNLDCLIVCDPFLRDPAALRKVTCPVVGYMIDVHRSLAPRLAYARYLDHVFVAQLEYLNDFSELPHPSIHWLPLACDRAMHFAALRDRQFEVGFVGKLGDAKSERRTTLERVLAEFATNEFERFYDAREMGEIYSRSKIVFNKSIGGDLNMRFFEGMASGALLVTDRIDNGMKQIGQDGEHYVTYRTIDEAIEKIRYYLAHDVEREVIASRGQQLVFAQHTYGHRLAAILSVVEQGANLYAPVRAAASSTEALWRSEHMMLNGASVVDVGGLMLEGHLTSHMICNSAVAVARGIVRPLRQAISANMKLWN